MDLFKRLMSLRFRISTQLFAAFGVAVALTVAASLIGWFSFNQVGEAQAEVTDNSIPGLEAAFGVQEYSTKLGAFASSLAAATDAGEVDEILQNTDKAQDDFSVHLKYLEQTDRDRYLNVNQSSEAVTQRIGIIGAFKRIAFDLEDETAALRDDMTELRSQLEAVLIPSVDDKLFYITTGRTELGVEPDERTVEFLEQNFVTYRHLAALQADTSIALQQMSTVFSLDDSVLVEAQKERFESSIASIERNMEALNDDVLKADLTPLYGRLEELGLTEREGIFDVLKSGLDQSVAIEEQVNLSAEQLASLETVVDELVLSAGQSADRASASSSQAIATGSTLLLAISIVSVLAALLISWLYVGRVLLHRINRLSARMRLMAAGQLDEEVEVIGHDELAEMASALEVFRHNSQEALRLNLVEELNTELEGKNTELETVLTQLEGKNTELESVLSDLQTAQDQIVMREKLAALGEVTAGVAHEIRNPLNFVKNFSELSEELLQEMREEIEGGTDNLDVGLITDISKDLVENLERIRHHGDRANRIVNDMLLMGRGSSNWQPIELNTLLVEHAMLAYHSARATDTEFQLTIEQNLDEDIGEVEAIPQDLGRTFLNIVGNACQATDERRRKLAEEGIGFEGYAPTVSLFTRGMEDEVEIRIRDNGPGIPQDVIEKIFNPFFTTKPTNQGTGLGLAITSDIIRQHGGTIQVESEPDQYTEMLITIPRTPPAEVVQDSTPALDHATPDETGAATVST